MFSSRSVLALGAALLALATLPEGAKAADEEVVTTAPAGKLPVSTASPPAAAGSDSTSSTSAITRITGGDAMQAPAKAPTALSLVHGSAGVSIGTGGYRSAYATAVMPVGDNGILGLAVSQTDYGKNGSYGYGDYGYGGYGRYGYGRRTGTATSAAIMLDLSHDRNAASTPEGCAPGFRDGDRYIEPLWVTRLRGSDTCDSTDQH